MIVDANVIVSAVLGRSRSLFHDLQTRGVEIVTSAHQFREAQLVSATLADRRGADPVQLFGWVYDLVLPISPASYEAHEAPARARLDTAGQRDWPLVALSLATGEAVWTHDKNLWGTGIATWMTRNIHLVPAEPAGLPPLQS